MNQTKHRADEKERQSWATLSVSYSKFHRESRTSSFDHKMSREQREKANGGRNHVVGGNQRMTMQKCWFK